ncbi:uncharacterized protein LOC115784319 isoform X2 [Archocentrus centrarchus]|uniref:uncharacterized protein LOC115784319 isoform X2 n=1 Tax=Archocentrus centrarchus TaxID=63155 RepID=UPI0011E9D5F9|nr:uncharacterized protein LOC115784319 isoform X2 [Archocentrus centrarchus]
METRGPRPSPQILLSDDDGGLWMKMDSDHVSSHTESPSAASGEKSQDESTVISAAPTSMVRYYSVMDDEGADDVFIPQPPPPPPSCTATLLPAEESTGATASNSGVTPSVDATEAEVNPRGLDLSHSEEQLMAARNKVDEEVTASAAQMSMDNILASDERDSPPPTYQDQKPMDVTGCLMETGHDATGRPYRNMATENEQPEDIVILSEGKENCWETNTEKDSYPKQLHANHKESSEYETHSDKEGNETKHKDVCGFDETDSKLLRENLDIESVETNASIDDDFELCKCNQNRTNIATHQPQVADFQADVAKENEAYDGHASLDCNLVKYDWVRRESGSTEMQVPPLPSSKGSEERVTMGEQEDGSRRIATDIQQGEKLLHRLQLVQLRHDVQMSENPHTQEQAVTRDEERGMFGTEIGNLTGEEEREESRFETLKKEDAKVSLMEKENNEDEDIQTKARTSSSTIPGEPEHQRIARLEPGDSDDNQSDSWVPPDLFPLNSHETSSTEIPFLSTGHRFSAAETSMERQLHEAAQWKQKLQRAGGVFNLAENPDVLEIPFKTHVSLESLPTKVGVSQCNEWQFSEQKMHKEISQDIQRELVLVNQGKIPGGYSKGELRQLKETKLLFEAFQQDNPEGPTRHHKSPTTLRKGHIYPSVLERTRSLEMFSLKTCPVSRAHSLRLYQPATAEKEKSPDSFRSKSPTGGSRDKTRLAPYPKQDKHVRLCRSMDSISNDVSTLAVDTKGKAKEANTNKESSILKQNPFFKLRPALALQPDVEKDIREAKEREEELRRQRRTLYGEKRQNSEDEEKSRSTQTLMQDIRKQSRGKLERVWPPPKKDQMKLEQTEEPKVHRAGGQKASLWQRWESGLINGKPSKEKK